MTYAMNRFQNVLGALWEPDECVGFERSSPDKQKCCPPDTWYNQTYAQLKGDSSLRRQNEEKIRHAMALLLAPTDAGFPTGLEQAAYDRGVGIASGFLAKLSTAATTFDLAFPRDRFVYKADRKKAPTYGPAHLSCQPDGYYSGYSVRAYWPDSRVKAVQALAGYAFTGAQIDQLARNGLAAEGDIAAAASSFTIAQLRPLEAPAPVREVFERVATVIGTGPGCRPDQHRDTMPQVSDLVTVAPGRGGGVSPSPWLQGFIGALSPQQSLAALFPELAGKLPRPPSLRLPWRPPTELNEEIAQSGGMPSRTPASGSSSMSTGAKVGIAVVGLGVGYAIYRAVS